MELFGLSSKTFTCQWRNMHKKKLEKKKQKKKYVLSVEMFDNFSRTYFTFKFFLIVSMRCLMHMERQNRPIIDLWLKPASRHEILFALLFCLHS